MPIPAVEHNNFRPLVQTTLQCEELEERSDLQALLSSIPLFLQIYSELVRLCLESHDSFSSIQREERQRGIQEVRSLQGQSGGKSYAIGNMTLLFFVARAAFQAALTYYAPGRDGLLQGGVHLLEAGQKCMEGMQGAAKASIDTNIHLVMNTLQTQEPSSFAKVDQLMSELLRLVGELHKSR